MWVNLLLFIVAVATAAYFYVTRHAGWYRAHGIEEIDYIFPFGNHSLKQAIMGKLPFVCITAELYKR